MTPPKPVAPPVNPSNGGRPTNHSHTHKDEQGKLVKCYHYCQNVLTNWQFWAGMTLGFPLEHLLWEKVWPFYLISHLLGL
jgi:hypothetical protein